ncbi:hypothetical protein [Streptomyces sp. 3N207]|uniref:hypothetical protein n=1 Tax=Streptomyces sp. 3N207 TaxID=3457417 RepID=UPI003FD349A2
MRTADCTNANDPSIALLQRISENGDASRQLLTGPDGSRHAKTLVDNKWQTPGPQPLDDAKWPAAVITAATMDRTGHPKESAAAAANVINAGSTEYGDEGKTSDYEKEQYPGANGQIQIQSQQDVTDLNSCGRSSPRSKAVGWTTSTTRWPPPSTAAKQPTDDNSGHRLRIRTAQLTLPKNTRTDGGASR